MLADYGDREQFDAEVSTRMSDELAGLRRACLAQAWGPEFPVQPSVCDELDDLPGALTYKTNQARWTIYLSPTCREITEDVEGDGKVGH